MDILVEEVSSDSNSVVLADDLGSEEESSTIPVVSGQLNAMPSPPSTPTAPIISDTVPASPVVHVLPLPADSAGESTANSIIPSVAVETFLEEQVHPGQSKSNPRVVEPVEISAPTLPTSEIDIRMDPTQSEITSSMPENQLAIYENGNHAGVNPFMAKIRAGDHSRSAYGDMFTPQMGVPLLSPQAADFSAPDYQEWLRSRQLSERKKMHQHAEWQQNLLDSTLKFYNPKMEAGNLPPDNISANFRREVTDKLFHGDVFTSGLEFGTYIPKAFEPDMNAESRVSAFRELSSENIYDEIQIEIRNNYHKRSKSSALKFLKTNIKPGTFIIVSDHGGASDGYRFQIWGPGLMPNLTQMSAASGTNYGIVKGSKDEYNINSDYEHIHGRFTIVRVHQNQIGILFDKAESTVLKMLPGRYFISEYYFAFIGLVTLNQNNKMTCIQPHSKDEFIVKIAKRFQFMELSPNNIAFVKDLVRTYYVLPNQETNKLVIFDMEKNQQIINIENMNNQVLKARDNSYYIVTLREQQFVVFIHNNKPIVWFFHPDRPDENVLHFPTNFYKFDGQVHYITEKCVTKDSLTVLNNRNTSEIVVIRDDKGKVRFIEESTNDPIILRLPWSYVTHLDRKTQRYDTDDGSVVRVMPTASQWTTILQEGEVKFYPPLLDTNAYYFYTPYQQVIDIVDRNRDGIQTVVVPGIGDVSIVNIPTGSIGKAKVNNAYFFLNPAMEPYIFIPPNSFEGFADTKSSHIELGDLHRICIKPNQIAVVSIDGQAVELPSKSNSFVRVPQEHDDENGVFIYRSNHFEIHGPVQKTDKSFQLGPYQYFRVDTGEVAYGIFDNEPKIWDVGCHSIDIRNGDQFKDFFNINVDPVEVRKFQISSLHNITSHINIYVTYSISNPAKTITQFTDHEALHKFIEETTKSEMLKLCASHPPIGYTDADFVTAGTTGNHSGDADDAMEEIETSFRKQVQTLLNNHGINLGDMHITEWRIDPEFLQASRENALKLQRERAMNEQMQIETERKKIETQKQLAQKEAELSLREKDNQIAKAKAITDAEIKASVEMAGQTAKATAELAVAEANFKIKQKETEIRVIEKEAEAKMSFIAGETQAKIQRLCLEAKYVNLEPAQIFELRKAELELERAKIVAGNSDQVNQLVDHRIGTMRQLVESMMGMQTQLSSAQPQMFNMSGGFPMMPIRDRGEVLYGDRVNKHHTRSPSKSSVASPGTAKN